MAISLPLLQKRRRSISHPLFPRTFSGRHPNVLYGIGARPNDDHRWPRYLQDRSFVQGHRLRGGSHVLLDERLLHRHFGLGHILLLHVHAEW